MERASAILSTDWLASKPLFYHEKSGAMSENIWDVIDFGSFEFHPEGLARYLEYGYSVFEQTPVRHVRFLPPNARCHVTESGALQIERLPDPVIDQLHTPSKVSDVVETMKASVRQWEASTDSLLVLPLSGGLDSRFLLWLLNNKSRVRAFTYGGAPRQDQSHEVVMAGALSKIAGISWQHIELGAFHRFLEPWIDLFGPATHAHGMYQMEFYDRILQQIPAGAPLLSGIIGDAWAGSVVIPPIHHPSGLPLLGYSHGMHANPSRSLLRHNGELAEAHFTAEREKLRDPLYRVVAAMRYKMMLLRYLLEVPRAMGYQPWTPFLDSKTALLMLNLPASLRADRKWQRDLFEAEGLALEKMTLSFSRANTLNSQAIAILPPPRLRVDLLREIIKPSYVEWINRTLPADGPFVSLYHRVLSTPKIKGVMKCLGCRNYQSEAYAAYLTLKPLEQLIEKRNQA